jgi:hypothetical protein
MPRYLLVAPLFLLCGACVTFEHPLCDPATATPDEALVGTWEIRGEKGWKRTMTITVEDMGKDAKPRKMMRAVKVDTDGKGKIEEIENCQFFTCDLAGHRFAHIESRWGGYWVQRYRVDGKRLTIWDNERAEVLSDLEDLKLPHTNPKGNSFGGGAGPLAVKATTAALRKTLTKKMAEQWWAKKRWETYTKVVPPKRP